MRGGLAWLLALAIFLGGPGGQAVASAAAGSTTEITLSDVGAGDLALQRGYSSSDVWLPGPGPVKINGGSFELRFDHVEHLNSQLSNLVVTLNDHLLKTISLSDSNSRATVVVLDLPAEYLNRDINHFNFSVWLSRATDVCTAADDQSLWLTISSQSRLVYQTGGPETSTLDLKDLPMPFVAPWLPQPSTIEMAIPNDHDPSVLSGALSMAGNLGEMSGGRPENLKVSAFDQLANSTDNVIAIGLAKDLQPIAGVSQDWAYHLTGANWAAKTGGQPLPPGAGLVALVPSPWQAGKALLVVSGNDAAGLTKAIGVLGTPEGRATLTGNLAVVDQFVPSNGTASIANSDTFARLGITDQRVSGVGNHSVNVRVPLSARDAAGQTVLHLRMLASPLLDGDRSSVQVSFNGRTLTAVRLPTSKPDQIVVSVTIPPGTAQPGFNTVGLAFSFYLPQMSACGPLPQEQAWATVLASSSVGLAQGTISQTFDLSALPYPIIGGTAPTLFVLPDDPSQWSMPLQLAYLVGRDAHQPVHFEGVTASQFSTSQAANHEVVLYGTPQNNHWIDDVGSRLPVGLGPGGQRTVDAKGTGVTQVTSTGRWGIVEVAGSPWATSQGLLLVTGSDATAAGWAALRAGGGGLSGPAVAVTDASTAVPIRPGNVSEARPAAPSTLRLALLGALPLALVALLALAWQVWVRLRRTP